MTGKAGPFLDHKIKKEGNNMKKAIALAIAALVLAGCNTISGVGKDVQKVGQVITGAGGK
jgi:predicted small secreted protein